jgi:lysozyme
MDALKLAADIAKVFEGIKLRPYLCPANVPTIGYGSTRYEDGRKVKMSDPPIGIERAEALLMLEMASCGRGALRYCPTLGAYPGRLAAITDFCYNLGVGRLQQSTLRRRINQGDWEAAKKELMKWVRGGGRVLPGLVSRRKAEAALM